MRVPRRGQSTPVKGIQMEEESEDLQIDLGAGSAVGSSEAAEEPVAAAMTWLEAAEHVLREENGPGMHIRDLTRTILDLGIVKSSSSSSLETLLYRQISKPASKFVRVPGKMGWFGLRKSVEEKTGEKEREEEKEIKPLSDIGGTTVNPSRMTSAPRTGLLAGGRGGRGGGRRGGGGKVMKGSIRDRSNDSWNFQPKVIHKKKKRDGGVSSASGSEGSDWSSSSDEESEALYHKRYIFIKKMAKSIIYENVAMAEQLKQIEQRIEKAEAEKQFLLDKYLKFSRQNKLSSSAKTKRVSQTGTSSVPSAKTVYKTSGSTSFASGQSVTRSPRGPPPLIPVLSATSSNTNSGAVSSASCLSALLSNPGGSAVVGGGRGGEGGSSKPGVTTGKRGGAPSGSRETGRTAGKSPSVQTLMTSEHSSSESSSSSSSECEAEPSHPPPPPSASPVTTTVTLPGAEPTVTKTKGKRRYVGKVRRLHPIPLNEDGSPVLPIHIGGLTVFDLGKIVYDRVAYHTERYLLPVGFHSSRMYPSMINPEHRTTYHCTVLDGGDVPLFEMRAEDSDEPVRATSSTACQSIVLRAINKARDRQATNSGSGPEFFGYSNPTILNLLQKLPNAGRCSKYKFLKFDSPEKPPSAASTTGASKGRSKKKATGKQRKKSGEKLPASKRLRLSVSPKPPKKGKATVSVVRKGGGGGGGGGGDGGGVSATTDPSLAPVLGSGLGQLGLETGRSLYSSSEEWSSSDSEHELTVDM